MAARSTRPDFPCPCCGYLTLSEPPGSHEVCAVCFWEDDAVQVFDPSFRGGANVPSLMECQASFASCGACEARFVGSVRPATPGEARDPEWRPATTDDLRGARAPRELSDAEREQPAAWYYWKRDAR